MPPTAFSVRPRKISIGGENVHRHDHEERQLAVDLLDDAEGLDGELQRAEDERELERAGDLGVGEPQEPAALHDARVDRDADARGRGERSAGPGR